MNAQQRANKLCRQSQPAQYQDSSSFDSRFSRFFLERPAMSGAETVREIDEVAEMSDKTDPVNPINLKRLRDPEVKASVGKPAMSTPAQQRVIQSLFDQLGFANTALKKSYIKGELGETKSGYVDELTLLEAHYIVTKLAQRAKDDRKEKGDDRDERDEEDRLP